MLFMQTDDETLFGTSWMYALDDDDESCSDDCDVPPRPSDNCDCPDLDSVMTACDPLRNLDGPLGVSFQGSQVFFVSTIC